MTSVYPKFEHGPRTYTVVEAVNGGQLTEARAGGIGVAGAASTKVLGVAQKPASPGGNDNRVTTNGLLNTVSLPSETVVFDHGTLPVTYAAAAVHGDRLKAAADGKVTPILLANLAAEAHLQVAVCAEPSGVAANGVGLARLTV